MRAAPATPYATGRTGNQRQSNRVTGKSLPQNPMNRTSNISVSNTTGNIDKSSLCRLRQRGHVLAAYGIRNERVYGLNPGLLLPAIMKSEPTLVKDSSTSSDSDDPVLTETVFYRNSVSSAPNVQQTNAGSAIPPNRAPETPKPSKGNRRSNKRAAPSVSYEIEAKRRQSGGSPNATLPVIPSDAYGVGRVSNELRVGNQVLTSDASSQASASHYPFTSSSASAWSPLKKLAGRAKQRVPPPVVQTPIPTLSQIQAPVLPPQNRSVRQGGAGKNVGMMTRSQASQQVSQVSQKSIQKASQSVNQKPIQKSSQQVSQASQKPTQSQKQSQKLPQQVSQPPPSPKKPGRKPRVQEPSPEESSQQAPRRGRKPAVEKQSAPEETQTQAQAPTTRKETRTETPRAFS